MHFKCLEKNFSIKNNQLFMGNPQVTVHLLGELTHIKFLRHLKPQGAANLAESALLSGA
jgi:hypothetical protein